ncbi:hypothetical protein YH65_02790 [Sulfurovum lithotrophicum]|uniref:FMN-binding domain-containing protein n=1 Tax=Sulfurovum lithotrophicum TaxID=206403 RepID=A0A7U4M094_9BACT|nr:FMN-binding protein [Sulfurovum lithotrophicum]AKF24439.1 hypothetical protein YH65_02790 [Sulfurovum lithotrophicum]
MKTLSILLCLFGFCWASPLSANIKVEQVAKSSFASVSDIEAKRIILTKEQHKQVQQRARAKVTTKVYRYYLFKSGGKTVGYGILISRKVRTKMATVLYGFTPAGTLKFSEIMAFGEPPEFIPNDTWMGQFKNKGRNAPLKMGKDIPTISGATLSARNISDGARIARALFEIASKK